MARTSAWRGWMACCIRSCAPAMSQIHSSLGFATLWTAPLTFPLMLAVQYICAKVGMVSGMGLASVLRRHYSRKVLFPAVLALLIANTINAGADIGAIAAAINLFIPVPITVRRLPGSRNRKRERSDQVTTASWDRDSLGRSSRRLCWEWLCCW